LSSAGYYSQKKTYGYQERNKEERAKFLKKIEKIAKDKLIYVDKAGFNNP